MSVGSRNRKLSYLKWPHLAEPSGCLVSKSSTDGSKGQWPATVLVMVALAMSLVVVAALLRVNMFQSLELDQSRFRASIVPASGQLAGIAALDGSEWVAKDDRQHLLVLFGVAAAGKVGDLEYWLDVASRSQSVTSDIQFVGLCVSSDVCGASPGSTARVVLLTSMDPLQTHALATGARQRRAYIFSGTQARGMVLVPADKAGFAAQIVDLSRPEKWEDGA